MSTTTDELFERVRSSTDTRTRVGGAWVAIGSVLLGIGFLLHPLVAADQAGMVATIADDPTRWVVAHGVTAAGLVVFAIGGLIVSTADSRLTGAWWTASAWAGLVVGALLVTIAAITEATVIAQAAVAGDAATIDVWLGFAEPYSALFIVFALSVATIAGNEARSEYRTTPTWASWGGMIAAVVSVLGMLLAFVAGIGFGSVIWIAGTVLMTLWTLWFGVVLARSEGDAWLTPEEPEAAVADTVQ